MKAIALVSGGIDSPVAALLASKKYKIVALHFCIYPFYCTGSLKSVISTLKKLAEIAKTKTIIVPWSAVLSKIAKDRYQCVLCRHAMLKAAEIIAKKEKGVAIVTGEVIAQKASQTLPNIAVTSWDISIPILRPLAALNKDDIIAISKQSGLSPESHVGCCSITPKRPILYANKQYLASLWSKLQIEKVINLCIKRKICVKNWHDISKYLNNIMGP
jgi:thiamine biosynthesis protein ThiI